MIQIVNFNPQKTTPFPLFKAYLYPHFLLDKSGGEDMLSPHQVEDKLFSNRLCHSRMFPRFHEDRFSGNPVFCKIIPIRIYSLNERQLPFVVPFPVFTGTSFLVVFLFVEPHRCHLSPPNDFIGG